MKKIITFISVLVLCLAMSVTALASYELPAISLNKTALKSGTNDDFEVDPILLPDIDDSTPSGDKKTTAKATTKKATKITVKATSIKKLVKGKKLIKVKWAKISGVKGYQIQLATNKNFKKNKKTVTVKGAKKTVKTVKKLKAKRKYYVRVRTYKTVNGKKYYSKWSKVKTIKTK